MSNLTDRQTATQSSMTATEQTLAEMWRELLRLGEAGPDDSFFDLGGTSLTAIKLLQRVENTFGPDVLSPDTLYGDPRLRSVARAIDEAIDHR